MSKREVFGLFALVFAAFLAFAGTAQGAEMKEGVFFIEPKDGARVKSPVKVVMGLKGMKLKPSGGVVKGTGHHHILVNKGHMRKPKVIPTDAHAHTLRQGAEEGLHQARSGGLQAHDAVRGRPAPLLREEVGGDHLDYSAARRVGAVSGGPNQGFRPMAAP